MLSDYSLKMRLPEEILANAIIVETHLCWPTCGGYSGYEAGQVLVSQEVLFLWVTLHQQLHSRLQLAHTQQPVWHSQDLVHLLRIQLSAGGVPYAVGGGSRKRLNLSLRLSHLTSKIAKEERKGKTEGKCRSSCLQTKPNCTFSSQKPKKF